MSEAREINIFAQPDGRIAKITQLTPDEDTPEGLRRRLDVVVNLHHKKNPHMVELATTIVVRTLAEKKRVANYAEFDVAVLQALLWEGFAVHVFRHDPARTFPRAPPPPPTQ